MSGRRDGIVAALLVLGAGLGSASPAAADFGPIRLVSRTAAQQADDARAPAISADGRYLAFQGRLGTGQGVFREDLASGAIVRVAAASPVAPGVTAKDAAAPSISADGRYVSFTTSAPLDPDDDAEPQSGDVYVADMSTSPPSYELASALDGCDPGESAPHAPCGLSYQNGLGSEATGRVALSADGRKVVFVTSAESNLTSGPGGSTEGELTPPRQVVLRDLDSDRTTLVSVERDAETGAMTERPVAEGALVLKILVPALRGAALSADGTTVAWVGTHLPAQVALPEAEASGIAQFDAGSFPYDEPLWRRVADGPAAPIRRIVAGDGAASPFSLLRSKNDNLNSAQGWLGAAGIDGIPQLSANGRTVALIGNPDEATNVFVVDMAAGLSRSQAVRQLTREIVIDPADPNGTINKAINVPVNGHIFDLAISGDGKRIAFTTARQRFPEAPPNLIGASLASLGLVELYVIDLENETLRRVTHALGGLGEPSNSADAISKPGGVPAEQGEGASAPSFGAGGLIAFGSTASNLVAGDSNESSDAFVVEDREGARAAGTVAISPAPAPFVRPPRWRLTLSARSLPDGGVRVLAGVPGAGRLRAQAGPEPGGSLRARRLTAARARAAKGGPVAIDLRLPRRYRRLARTPEGLYATTLVSFHGAGGKALRGQVQVRFHVHPKRSGGRR